MKNIDFDGIVLSVPNKTNRVVYTLECDGVYRTHTYWLYNLALGATPNSSCTVEHLGTFVFHEVSERIQKSSPSMEKYFDADGTEVAMIHHDNAARYFEPVSEPLTEVDYFGVPLMVPMQAVKIITRFDGNVYWSSGDDLDGGYLGCFNKPVQNWEQLTMVIEK